LSVDAQWHATVKVDDQPDIHIDGPNHDRVMDSALAYVAVDQREYLRGVLSAWTELLPARLACGTGCSILMDRS
jgi:hypothetical protein